MNIKVLQKYLIILKIVDLKFIPEPNFNIMLNLLIIVFKHLKIDLFSEIYIKPI